jgi:hypothetical protein
MTTEMDQREWRLFVKLWNRVVDRAAEQDDVWWKVAGPYLKLTVDGG